VLFAHQSSTITSTSTIIDSDWPGFRTLRQCVQSVIGRLKLEKEVAINLFVELVDTPTHRYRIRRSASRSLLCHESLDDLPRGFKTFTDENFVQGDLADLRPDIVLQLIKRTSTEVGF
jgi:hypothetical protein